MSEDRQMTMSEAGKRGGLKVLAERGKEHFSEIGKKGQKEMRKRYPGAMV